MSIIAGDSFHFLFFLFQNLLGQFLSFATVHFILGSGYVAFGQRLLRDKCIPGNDIVNPIVIKQVALSHGNNVILNNNRGIVSGTCIDVCSSKSTFAYTVAFSPGR